MSLSRKVAWNTAIQFIGRAITMGINLILLRWMLTLLQEEGYGRYATVFAFVSLFELLADMGLNTIITKYIARDEHNAEKTIANILGMRLLLSLCMISAIAIAIPFTSYSMDEKIGILLASISSVALLFNAVMMGIFQIKLKLEWQVVGSVAGSLLTLAIVGIAFLVQGSLLMVISARVLGNLFLLLITWFLAKKYFPLRFSFDWPFWKQILKEAMPIGIAIIFWRLYFTVDILLLRSPAIALPTGSPSHEAVVGIYQAAYKVLDFLISIVGMFMVATFPVLAKYAFSDKKRFQIIYQKAFDLVAFLAFPMVVSVYFLAEKVIAIFSKGFSGSVELLQILVFAAFFSFFNSLNNGTIVSLNKHIKLLYLNIFLFIFNATANIIVIPLYGSRASATITVFTEAVIFFSYYAILRTTHFQLPKIKLALQSLLASLCMGVVLWITLPFNLIINGCAGVLTFCCCMLLLDPSMIKKIFSRST